MKYIFGGVIAYVLGIMLLYGFFSLIGRPPAPCSEYPTRYHGAYRA